MAIDRKTGLVPLLLAAAACSGGEPTPAPAPAPAEPAAAAPAPAPDTSGPRPSLVLITLDTTRADRLGAYGYPGAHTPTVDRLAQEGLRFERAYAVVPLTTPSHASMLTGLYPTRHGIHNNGDAILSDDVVTLAEVLKGRGYSTAAAISAFVTTRVWNLDQGFDAYFDDVESEKDRRNRGRWARERSADAVVDDIIGWLGTQPADQPYFVWLHFYDAHDPYEPPKEWAEKLGGRMYDGEVAFVDHQLGRLREAIDARSQQDGTAWMILADHGEALDREHGEHTHGMYVFDPTMRIPFIVRPPTPLGAPKVESVHTVSNVDVTPTALGLLGAPPILDVDGVDLSPFVTGEGPARDPVYMEAESAASRFGFAPERAVAHGPLKLIDTPNPRLFDVVADPKEERNLVGERPPDVVRLRQYHEEKIKARRVESTGGMASPEVMEQLAALGYIGSEGGVGDEKTAMLDAKDQGPLINKLDRARLLGARGKPKEAIALYREIIAEQPQIAEARMGLARLLSQTRQHDEAEATLRQALELQPSSTVIRVALSNTLASVGRLPEALDLMQTILAQVPGDDTARNGILRLMIEMGKMEEALKLAQQWQAEAPKDLNYAAYLGVILTRMGRFPEAIPQLQSSLADDMPRQNVHGSLALIHHAMKRPEQAVEALKAESAWFPTDMRTRMLLGHELMSLQRWDEAAAEYGFVVERRPQMIEARLAWAQATFNTGDYPGAETQLAPALKQAPDNPDVLLLQANILQKLGKDAEAKTVFEEATRLHKARIAQREAEAVPGAELEPGLQPEPVDYLKDYAIPE
jgi:arylsulfatase A-like enzyme/Flp pilus assembly protein TadD